MNQKIQQKLQVGDSFPFLQGRMISGTLFHPSLLQGKRVFYSFFRYTGCPACFVYFNQLQLKHRELENHNIAAVFIYEVELKILQEFFTTAEKNFWGTFIADPNARLYEACRVGRSQLGRNYSLLSRSYRQAIRQARHEPLESLPQGQEMRQTLRDFAELDLLRHGLDASGKHNRMPAQFLVDSKNMVELAHYGKNLSDRLPLEKLLG